MFLVPTYLSESPIHGLGVFTVRRLRAGTPIWEFDDRVDFRISAEEMASVPIRLQEILRVYSYRECSGQHVFCGDHARFMNHSETPNCDDDGVTIRVNRSVPAHTELTCDYRLFDVDAASGLEPYVASRSPTDTPTPRAT